MPDASSPTVLVVDDHLDTCQMLIRLLRQLGYRAVCRESGRDALEFLDATPPDLMILDMMMPDMSGLDVLKVVRAKPDTRDVPVIMYSAMSDEETARAALETGAQDFIVKGRLTFGEIRGVVERHVRRSDA